MSRDRIAGKAEALSRNEGLTPVNAERRTPNPEADELTGSTSAGMGRIAGIVLAAGASTRMGRNKLLFELGGDALVCRAVRAVSGADLDPAIVVLGHEAERARQALGDLACVPVLNPEYARGINTSLRAGIRAVPPDAQGAVVVLADMPFITPSMLAALVARYRATAAPLVVSRYGEVTAPPILYARAVFAELMTAEGERCGKHVVKRHRDEAACVDWPVEALADLDRPEDYERVKAAFAGHSTNGD